MYRILIYSLTLLTFVGLVAFQGANADQFLHVPINLSHDPTVCAFEPQPDQEFPSVGKKLLDQTEYSILDWKMKLNEGLGKHPLWNIKLIKVPLSSQNSFNYSGCDITIHYLRKPAIQDLEFVLAGITIPNFDTGKTNIEIYYLGINTEAKEIDLSRNADTVYYTYVNVPYYTGYLDTDARLAGTIRHEIGHALGLGHYVVTAEERDKIVNGMQDMPSIMIDTVTVIGVTHFDITPIDVSQIKTKYGDAGFNKTLQGNGFSRIHVIRMDKPSYQAGDKITVSVDTTSLKEDTHSSLTIIDSYNSMSELFDISKMNSTIMLNSGGYKEGKYYAEYTNYNDSSYDYTSFTIGNGTTPTLASSVKESTSIEPDTSAQPSSPIEIPVWVKNNAMWWSQGSVSDEDFINGMQYLIQKGIMKIPHDQSNASSSHKIPVWVKNNAGWWASGQISDGDFVKGIQYLISVGIVKV